MEESKTLLTSVCVKTETLVKVLLDNDYQLGCNQDDYDDTKLYLQCVI